MLGASEVFEIIKVDSKINEVAVPTVSSPQTHETKTTLPISLEQQYNNVSELRTNLLPSEKTSIIVSLIQESHQTTINP